MFSGSDSTESQNYTQWPLNASAYQSMQTEEVDWAALAHQWIKMKEAGPPLPEKTPSAPPPPVISTPSTASKGEAPMDVENDSDSNNMGSDSNDGIQWNQPQQPQSGNWNNWNSNPWPPAISSIPLNKAALLPTPAAYNTFSTNTSVKEEFSSGNSHANTQSPGYWTGNGSPNPRSSTNARVMKPHNKRFSKVNVPLKTPPLPPHIGSTTSSNDASPPFIDANKRKQLPAWIREGLEKMERDKLKQMDKYKVKEKTDDYEREKKKLREEAMEILKSTVTSREKEKVVKVLNDYGDGSQVNDSGEEQEDEQEPPPAPQITQFTVSLTHEEMMLKVRRTMTEILLKVTNREIAQICKEEHQRHVRKLKAVDQHVTAPSAGANLSARLGLGAYDGSGESSDESGGEDEKTELDSDNELRDAIRRRKEEFEKTEREIEQRLADAEAEKDTENASKSRRESFESDDSSKPSPTEKAQEVKFARKATKRSDVVSSNSRSTSRSTSSSADRRSRRSSRERDRDRDRRRRSPSSTSSKRRSCARRDGKRRHSRSRSRSRSPSRSRTGRGYHRRDSHSRSTRRRSRSQSYSRRRSRRRSRTRSRSRSYDGGRGKRSHKH